nr:hypothetical protein [Altericroceibacterium endophyticum]
MFLGLYALAAGIGELRSPGGWAAMVEDLITSHGLRFLTGIVCIAIGAALYCVCALRPGDWLAIALTVIGGICAAEGALILASGDRFMIFARRLMAKGGPIWAGLSTLIGAGFLLLAFSRI